MKYCYCVPIHTKLSNIEKKTISNKSIYTYLAHQIKYNQKLMK